MRRILPVLVAGLVGLILFDRFGKPVVRSAQATAGDAAPAPRVPGRGSPASPARGAAPAPPVPSASPAAPARDGRLEYLTVQAMAGRVQPGAAPTVLVLYGTNCPLSRQLMPGLQQIATQYQGAGLRVLAINVDDDEPFYDVPAFLAATGARFPPIRVPRQPGELSAALNSLGSKAIPSGQKFTMPVVVVWGRRGTVLAEAQGMADASALEQVVRVAVDPGS
jgi:thiol-disulfide isomerase/thioredoxin